MCDCQNGGSCDHVTGVCTCAAGYQGPRCTQTCTGSFYGSGCSLPCQCVHGTCHHVDGSCTCSPGYVGVFCNECKSRIKNEVIFWFHCLLLACLAFQYGDQCGLNCTCVVANTDSCSNINGDCDCKPGYRGNDCELSKPRHRNLRQSLINFVLCSMPERLFWRRLHFPMQLSQ